MTGLALLVAGLVSTNALAHGGLQAGIGSVRLAEGVAHVHVAPAPGAFDGFDTDGDGTLEHDEVTAQREAIVAHAVAGLTLTTANGVAPEIILADVNLPAHLHPGEAPYVRITLQVRWDAQPDAIILGWAYGDVAPLTIRTVATNPVGTTRMVDLTLNHESASATAFGPASP